MTLRSLEFVQASNEYANDTKGKVRVSAVGPAVLERGRAGTPGPWPFAAAAGGFNTGGYDGQGYGGPPSTFALPPGFRAPSYVEIGQSSVSQTGGIS